MPQKSSDNPLVKTLLATLVLMLGFLFTGAPVAYAHTMATPVMEGCHKMARQAKPQAQHDSVVFVKAEKQAAQMPCHENCPSGGKMATKGGCCMTSCASISFINHGPVIGAAVATNGQVSARLASAFASITPSGPQKPPRLS